MRLLLATVRRGLKELSFRAFFLLDRIGLHVLPRHYYSAIPDYGWLRRNRGVWMGRAPMTGVAWDLEAQMAWVRETCGPYRAEVSGLELYSGLVRSDLGPGFGPIESQVLHCFVRRIAPPRIVEVGSGVSTYCILNAVAANVAKGGNGSLLTCVEPFPGSRLRREERVRLVPERCQTAPRETFDQLKAGDLLFVDSSHAVKTGSDVLKLYLEIVPRLPAGVFIHAHDIYLPYLYARRTLTEYLGGQETSLVLALLTRNAGLLVLAGLAALHYDRTDALREALPDYDPQANREGLAAPGGRHFPSSLWMVTA